MANPQTDDNSKRLNARLALTDETSIANWQKKEDYLERRKLEAAKAMASDEQKKIREEAETASRHKLEAQKKLAELEAVRKAEEERQKKDVSAIQRDKDLAQEKLRQAKIKQILEAQKEIAGLKKSPESRLSSIHTLTDDLSEEIRAKGLTASRLARANNQERSEAEKTFSLKKTLILTLSFILIFGGATAVSWSLWHRTKQSQALVQLTHNSLIFADQNLAINLDAKSPEQIKQELKTISQNETGTNLTREKITDIYFVTGSKIASSTIFASSTGLAITDDLLRFLKPDFMLGLYVGAPTGPFYIFKTDYYKNSADALLKNENEIVSQLLSPFVDAETLAKIQSSSFQDKMVMNRSVRLVSGEDNRTLAVYAWFDKNTIAVASDEFILAKVLNAFLTPKPVVK